MTLLLLLPPPGLARDTSAPRTHSRSCPKRTKSRPAATALPPPLAAPPRLRRHDSLAPPPPHCTTFTAPILSEGLMSPAPPLSSATSPRQSLPLARPPPPPRRPPASPPPLLAPFFPLSLSQQISHPMEAGPPPSTRHPISCPRNPLFVAVSGAPWASPSPSPTRTQTPGVV